MDSIVSLPIPGRMVEHRAGGTPPLGTVAPLGEFVVGPENRLVTVAIRAVLEDPPGQYSPIVFYGPTGTGKSHLATGLISVWKSRSPGRPAWYVPALDFARDLNDAIETQSVDDFQARYRQASLVVFDDVDRLSGKPAAQRELLYTLDALNDSGGWVVLTSATAPELLTGILPNLQSRLLAALTVPLALPGPETRLAILGRLTGPRSIVLAESAAKALAEGLNVPVSGLAGALNQLALAAKIEGQPIELEHVERFLAGRTKTDPSLRDIAVFTAKHFSLKLADLRSPSRRRAVVTARDVAMYLARTLTGKSLQQIGSYFDGRDHTTVSHGCGKTERLLQTDPAIREAVETLRERLQPV